MARRPPRGDSWSGHQVSLEAGCTKAQFRRALRAGHISDGPFTHRDVAILRVAVAMSALPPAPTPAGTEAQHVTDWERDAVALTREALSDGPAPEDLLLIVAEKGVMLTSGDRRARAIGELTTAGVDFVCIPVGAWSALAYRRAASRSRPSNARQT